MNIPDDYYETTPPPPIRRFLGLPTRGLMGTEPALTIGGLVTFGTIIVAAAAAFLGWHMPGEWGVFFDTHGKTVGIFLIGALPIVQGWITRERVVSPATAIKAATPPSITTRG
jgi:hypothetical protein